MHVWPQESANGNSTPNPSERPFPTWSVMCLFVTVASLVLYLMYRFFQASTAAQTCRLQLDSIR